MKSIFNIITRLCKSALFYFLNRFDEEEEGVAIANATTYGLMGKYWIAKYTKC